jgi:hypothetical protein
MRYRWFFMERQPYAVPAVVLHDRVAVTMGVGRDLVADQPQPTTLA